MKSLYLLGPIALLVFYISCTLGINIFSNTLISFICGFAMGYELREVRATRRKLF